MLTRLALSVVFLLTLTACSSENADTTATDPGSETTAAQAEDSPTTAASVDCTYPSDGQSPAKDATPPADTPALSGTVPSTISLNAGDVAVALDADAAPCTVNSFASLAEQGYFDGTQCHRLTTEGIFVLQCGDPSATGMGGPGYSFADELSGTEQYSAGTVAMANAGPNTNGSQFFIVFQDSMLPPAYTVFGHLDAASLKVVQKIGKLGTDTGGPDGAPKKPVTITGVTVG